jgi:hypothetical protein
MQLTSSLEFEIVILHHLMDLLDKSETFSFPKHNNHKIRNKQTCQETCERKGECGKAQFTVHSAQRTSTDNTSIIIIEIILSLFPHNNTIKFSLF